MKSNTGHDGRQRDGSVGAGKSVSSSACAYDNDDDDEIAMRRDEEESETTPCVARPAILELSSGDGPVFI